ncbi:ATR-interacting protein [Holothuria leucospilota]|uniref:ATR-interacting protein n=1 Tax=Holothuria leucospilota TaxID=206669 RepID=A0A9Q1HIB5_HOLLE|nr:ATR-interacting protein [Holothuria leucospilota]
MSINPLFSGPGQYSRNPPSRPPLGILANSASNMQPIGEMESVTPRKKPRLNSAGNTYSETEDGADPFGDFEEESFTADDLAAIDRIATQALSQATTDNIKNNSGQSAAGSAPRTQFASSKQTSRNYLHQKNVFPVNGVMQNRNRSVRDSSSQPPLYLQNKVQTNVDIPFHQLGRGNSKLLSSQVETRTNNFRKNTSTSTGGEGSSQENHLTPLKGTTVVDSSALPSGAQDELSQLRKLQQQVERYRSEAEALTQQLKTLKSEKYTKDGEIEVLRQNLNKAQTDISRLKMERIQEDEQQKREQVSKEKELQKEVETLKTQLEFKDREIIEAQTSFRNLQQRTVQMDEQKSSRDTFPSPRKSPKLVHVTSPPKCTNFPSQASFVAGSSKHQKGPESPKPSKCHREEQKRPSTCKSPGSSAISGGSPSCHLTNKVLTPPSYGVAVQIKTRFPNGRVTPSQMVGLLMKKVETETYDEPMQEDGYIMGLYHGPSEIRSKHSSDSDAGQSSRICQSEAKELQKPSSCMTASLSISRLLNPPSDTLEPLEVPLPRHPTATGTNSSFTTAHLTNLLPHLQELLDNYVQELERLVAANTRSTKKYNRSNSVPSDQTEDLTEIDNELRSQEQNLGLGLQALNRLCSHSEPVCKIIVAGFDQRQEDMDISVDEIDPSAPIISTQTDSRPSSSISSSRSSINPFNQEPCRILQLLQLVLKSNPVKDHPTQKLRELGWKVVFTLSRNCPKSNVKW